MAKNSKQYEMAKALLKWAKEDGDNRSVLLIAGDGENLCKVYSGSGISLVEFVSIGKNLRSMCAIALSMCEKKIKRTTMTKQRLTTIEARLRVPGLRLLAVVGFALLVHDLDADNPMITWYWSLLLRIAGAGMLYLAYRASKGLHERDNR